MLYPPKGIETGEETFRGKGLLPRKENDPRPGRKVKERGEVRLGRFWSVCKCPRLLVGHAPQGPLPATKADPGPTLDLTREVGPQFPGHVGRALPSLTLRSVSWWHGLF